MSKHECIAKKHCRARATLEQSGHWLSAHDVVRPWRLQMYPKKRSLKHSFNLTRTTQTTS